MLFQEETSSPTVSAHNMEPLCTRYNFLSSSMADSWVNSDRKPVNRSAENMKKDKTLGDVEHQVAQEDVSFDFVT